LGGVRWRLWRYGQNTGVLPLHFVQGQDDGFGEEFGEGGEEAVGLVEDEVFDERLWLWRGFGGGCGGGAGFAGQEASDDLQAVEELAGAGGIEVVGGDAAEQVRGDLES
jgi:hypothetical protein